MSSSEEAIAGMLAALDLKPDVPEGVGVTVPQLVANGGKESVIRRKIQQGIANKTVHIIGKRGGAIVYDLKPGA